MKKFLFVLLVLMVGVLCVTAGPAHPSPGAPALEIALPGYGVDAMAVLPQAIVAPATFPDLVLAMVPLTADQARVLAEVVIDKSSTKLQEDIIDTGQIKALQALQPDFYLRC